MDKPKVTYHQVTMRLCSLCLDGKGGMCHEPGCALIRNRAPDFPLWGNGFVTRIDGVGLFRGDDSGDLYTEDERKALVMKKAQRRVSRDGEAFLLAESIAENDSGGAALKSGGRWYACPHSLWQFAAWPEIEFTVRKDGTVKGIRAAQPKGEPRG